MKPPQDNLFELLDEFCPNLKNGDVLLITSKIVSIHQKRCVSADSTKEGELIRKEADHIISHEEESAHAITLTIKNNILIPNAGIDKSNANGFYILWPKEPHKIAREICEHLQKKFLIEKLGVVIVDSHTTPLRMGVVGIALGFFGFNPLRDYRGSKDIFGRKLEFTRSNLADALATMGVLAMGEGNECTPLALVRDANFLEFTNEPKSHNLKIPIKEDIYFPLMRRFFKKKK